MSVLSEMSIELEESTEAECSYEYETLTCSHDEDDGGVDDSLLNDMEPVDTNTFNPFDEQSDEQPDEQADEQADEQTKSDSSNQLSYAQKKEQHDAQEAKRKEEWEAAQKSKQEKEAADWMKSLGANNDELFAASVARIASDIERITRRNMKECVSQHITDKCITDLAFARQALHPRKSMMNCFRYINRQALEFMKQELKDNGEEVSRDGMGSDVPDDLCYKWAEEYFYDMDAPEDHSQDEQFKPRSYYGSGTSTAKKPVSKPPKKLTTPKAEKAKPPKPVDDGQIALWGGIAG